MANCIRRFLLARDEFVERRLHRTERGHPARSTSKQAPDLSVPVSTGLITAACKAAHLSSLLKNI
jgi:hypothetical protein